MTTLITGGGSQTGIHLAKLLKGAGLNVVFASRSGKRIPEGFKSVTLDWYDPQTYETPFKAAGPFESVYLVGPPDDVHPTKYVIPFIDLAVQNKVKRFVYLSASGADKDNDAIGLGRVPGYLEEKELDYLILRPTWFTDNLGATYIHGIRTNAQFETVVPTGRVPFIAVQDIAQAAFEGITGKDIAVRNVVIIGPELLTYDELASITSDVVGKKITHKAVSPEELKEIYLSIMNKDLAEGLIDAELGVEAGSEEKWGSLSSEEQKRLGIKVFVGAVGVREWIERHKDVFSE